MDLAEMIEAATWEFKQKLSAHCENLDLESLTPQLAEQVTSGLGEAFKACGIAALRTFLEAYEVDEAPKQVENVLYRFKQQSEKTFLTPFGKMKLSRNLFQADEGGPSYVPLDVMWGMVGEFATVEVREAVLFTVSLITPEETVSVLEKTALFQPSATAVKHITEETGAWLVEMDETLNRSIRQEEENPKGTKVMVASLDGTHLRLDEPGKKRGRPQERPGEKPSEESPTSFKQALVGSLSFYGAPPKDGTPPKRLVSRYVAQMPEEGGQTLKIRFEEELDHIEGQLKDEVGKVFLCDGARGLWKYADTTPRFIGYEKLVGFYHTTEHLSEAAELLFGKKSAKAQSWYETYHHKLLTQDGAAETLIRSIDYYKSRRRLGQKRLEDLETERTFFFRNKHRMAYADFRRRGLPIGSGPVEAACKTLVKTRLCRSGMQWSWQGGQRILQLRTYVKSKRWDAFWNQYKQVRYANDELLDYADAA